MTVKQLLRLPDNEIRLNVCFRSFWSLLFFGKLVLRHTCIFEHHVVILNEIVQLE